MYCTVHLLIIIIKIIIKLKYIFIITFITINLFPCRGIEWLSHNSLLTYAYPPPNNNGLVRNELAAVNLDTGHVTQLKKGETTYVQPITSIRISTHK